MSTSIRQTARTTVTLLAVEAKTAWRSKRLLILAAVFVLLGFAGPLAAKLTPAILQSAPGGAQLARLIPEPDSLDSWAQFYKSMTQLGIYMPAIILSGMVSHDVSSGALVNLVAKGLPRPTVIAAKYLSALVQWALSITLAFSITWGYTLYYFPDGHGPHPLTALAPLLAFGFFFMAALVLGSALARSNHAALLTAVIVQVALMALNTLDRVKRYNPVSLLSGSMPLLKGDEDLCRLAPAFLVSLVAAAACLTFSALILSRKRL
ncbi:ABC transporter permease [Bifidobacterium xylocopae]|uniref:ABC transporter permease n=1 Tax=Bifidobacterium xylocopae TaxID=2493119 RepID=A0A366KFB5_9BIFI|nr:ABC transporter permease subunit [Bifidobacterium xylocopae]RBP99381.1 ABC transporter permease [Bifidobacterium xylocopae]